MFMPLGRPVGAWIFMKYLKTKVKMNMVASGLSSDHAQPSTERLYFERSSRSVRLTKSSRELRYSATVVTTFHDKRGRQERSIHRAASPDGSRWRGWYPVGFPAGDSVTPWRRTS